MSATTTKMDTEPTWIDDLERIPGYLEKAAQELEYIEVQINGRNRMFFTFFAEDGPTPPKIWDDHDAPMELDSAYFDYMTAGEHLFFMPVRPDEGNTQLREGDRVLFRFFLGVNAIEGQVTFQKAVWNRHGERVLKTTFPQQLRLIPQRRHFRARVPANLPLNCRVEAAGMTPFNARVIDLSVGGVSLKTQASPEEMPNGREVTLTLEAPELPHLRLRAYARESKPMVSRHDDGLGLLAPNNYRCGYQFDLPTLASEAQVSEFVVLIQRESLKSRCRTRERHRTVRQKPSVRKQLSREVNRLLHRLRPATN